MNHLLVALGLGGLALFLSRRAKADPVDPPTPPEPTKTFLNPPGWRRAKGSEVTPEMDVAARAALVLPMGTFVPYEALGYAIGLESHFHEPGGPVKPWGWHKGVTIFVKI